MSQGIKNQFIFLNSLDMRTQFKPLFILLLSFFTVSIACISPPSLAGDTVSPKLLGLWVVQDSACNGCDPAKGAETGAVLRISDQGIQDPFSSDCNGVVESKETSTESYAKFQERLGVPERWLVPQAKAEHNTVTHFDLYCGGKSFLKIISLPNGDLLRPAEASTVLRFRRPG